MTSFTKQKIEFLINKIRGFKEFCKFNQIDHNSIRVAAGYLKLRKCLAHEVLFRQLDKADHFYGVLQGCIGVNVVFDEEILKKYKESKRLEKKFAHLRLSNAKQAELPPGVEVIKFTEGNCFGQWGLLEKKERTGTAIAKEDTYLFEMSKEGFEDSFKKCLKASERNKKKFLSKTIDPLRHLPEHTVDYIYRQVVPVVLI